MLFTGDRVQFLTLLLVSTLFIFYDNSTWVKLLQKLGEVRSTTRLWGLRGVIHPVVVFTGGFVSLLSPPMFCFSRVYDTPTRLCCSRQSSGAGQWVSELYCLLRDTRPRAHQNCRKWLRGPWRLQTLMERGNGIAYRLAPPRTGQPGECQHFQSESL